MNGHRNGPDGSGDRKVHDGRTRLEDPELQAVTRRRDRRGWLAAVFGTLFLAALGDLLVARIGQSAEEYRLVAGTSEAASGPLTIPLESPSALRLLEPPEGLELRFDAIQRGYWLGTPQWRGTLSASPDVPPGTYPISIGALGSADAMDALANRGRAQDAKLESPEGPGLEADTKGLGDPTRGAKLEPARDTASPREIGRLVVRVAADAKALRRDAAAWSMRHLGVSPVWPGLGALALMAGTVLEVLRLSARRDRCLSRLGLAEIHHVALEAAGAMLRFEATAISAMPGTRLRVLDERGDDVAEAELLEVDGTRMTARVAGSTSIRPGFLVAFR